MRTHLPPRSGLLLVLIASAALAGGPDDTTVIRTLKVSDSPNQPTHAIYVAGQVATVLRFEQDVDPSKTRLLGWEGRFEPLLVGSKKVILEPLRDLNGDEGVPLLVTLKDGTEIPFLVRPKRRSVLAPSDHQVNVFKDHEGYSAVLASLHDSMVRERELSDENERLKKEENSVDHAFATLLANGQLKKTPFRREVTYRSKNAEMDTVVEVFSGPGKAAAVITLTNTYHDKPWQLERATLIHMPPDMTSATPRSFALRMNRASIVTGQSGTIAVVADKSAFMLETGQIADLTLQLFRGDGLLEVMVPMDHMLVRQ